MQDVWILAQVLFGALRWAHLTRTGKIIGHRPISPSHVANLAGLSVSACGVSHIINYSSVILSHGSELGINRLCSATFEQLLAF